MRPGLTNRATLPAMIVRRPRQSLSIMIGKLRTRFPVAWKIALAIAAGVPTMPIPPGS